MRRVLEAVRDRVQVLPELRRQNWQKAKAGQDCQKNVRTLAHDPCSPADERRECVCVHASMCVCKWVAGVWIADCFVCVLLNGGSGGKVGPKTMPKKICPKCDTENSVAIRLCQNAKCKHAFFEKKEPKAPPPWKNANPGIQ
eukprot:Tamp_17790.p3 GENE.Tamp_17790~~Tamp_17790.p3  ORF type:complete len:142 (-),score=23.84 Tamp_17790:62-487(-)